MPDKTYDILIDIRSRAAALDLTKEIANARKEAEAFNTVFKASAAAGAQVVAQAREEVAILSAQAAGQKGVVRLLEQQRAVQQEISRLTQGGASQREAQAIAATKVSLQADIAARAIAKRQQEAAVATAQIAAQTRAESTREIAILQARVASRTDIVRRLEREKALEAEINRLREKGLSLDEARGLALQKVNAQAQLAVQGGSQQSGGGLSAAAIGASVIVAQQLLSIATEIPRRILNWTEEGVRFNALLEDAQRGVAAVSVAFQPGVFRTFDEALNASADTVELLKQKAKETSATFQELLEGYQANAGPIFQVGISKSQEQINLLVAASQAMSALGIPAFQLNQELRGVLSGDTSRISRLNQVLGVTKEQLEAATTSGTAYQFLMAKLKPFVEAAKRGQDSFNIALSNTRDNLQQLAGVATEELFVRIKSSVLDLNKALAEDQSAEKAAAVGAYVAQIVTGFLAVDRLLAQVTAKLPGADALNSLVGGPAQEAAAERFLVTESLRLAALEAQIRSAETLEERKAAQKAIDESIANLTRRAKDENQIIANIVGIILPQVKSLKVDFESIAGSTVKWKVAMAQTAEQIAKASKIASAIENIRVQGVISTAQISGNKEGEFRAKLQQETVNTYKQLIALGAQEKVALEESEKVRQQMLAAHEKEVATQRQGLELHRLENQSIIQRAKGNTEAADAAQRHARVIREYNDLISDGLTDERAAWQEAERKVAAEDRLKAIKEGQRGTQRELLALRREESNLLKDIRVQAQLISESPFLTADQKTALLIPLLQQEREELVKLVEAWRAYLIAQNAKGDLAGIEEARGKIQQLEAELQKLTTQGQALTFGGGIQAGLINWVNSFSTAAQQVSNIITGTLNTAIAATSQLITDAIFRTGDWRKAFTQAAQAIVQNLIQIGIQMLVNAALSSIIKKKDATEAGASGAAIAAGYAPAAAAASIATSGSSAYLGAIAAAVAIAAILALLLGGFKEGGYTGGAGTTQIAGVVHGREFVHPQPTVDFYGLAIMEALRQRRIPPEALHAMLGNYSFAVTPRFGGFESGGAVAALGAPTIVAGSGAPREPGEMKVIVLHDKEALRKELFNSSEADIFVVDAVNRNFHRIRKNA